MRGGYYNNSDLTPYLGLAKSSPILKVELEDNLIGYGMGAKEESQNVSKVFSQKKD